MKKLNLDIDALVVESFDSLPAPTGRRGTVQGNLEPGTIEPASNEPGCFEFTGPDRGCALSDDDGTCYISQCGQPGCYSDDFAGCYVVIE